MSHVAYVIDDETLAVDRLVRLLEETGKVTVAGATTSPRTGRAYLESHTVDVLFLDITMPKTNGFELLASLPDPPWVVFTTAYDEFALKAFEANAIDYLLKPIQASHLARALQKLDRVETGPAAGLRRIYNDVINALEGRAPAYPERLASRLGDRVSFVDVDAVSYVYADHKLTYAVAAGKSYCIDAPLSDLQRRLDPRRFIRIHRSTVVNVRWVSEARTGAAGEMILELADDKRTRLAVARSRVADVKSRLGL